MPAARRSSSTTGSTTATATRAASPATSDYLVGLAESYARRRVVLSDQQRTHIRRLIDRAADYLLLASDAGTGKFQFESATRPYNNDDPTNTAAGVRGLARFAAAMQGEERDQAERAYRRARLRRNGCWLTRRTSTRRRCGLPLASSLPVSRPIAVTVTELKHPRYLYDITDDSPEKSASFNQGACVPHFVNIRGTLRETLIRGW